MGAAVPSVAMLTPGEGGRPGRDLVRVRAVASRVVLGVAALSLLLGLATPGVRAQEPELDPDLPDSFVASASASALDVAVLTPALVPVPGLFEFSVAEGRGSYETSNQEARASVFYPGNGAIIGPNLFCDTFGSEIPPEGEPIFGPIISTCLAYQYPLSVFADSLHPDGQTEGALVLGTAADPVSLQAVGARAHADIDAATTDSEVSDLRVLGAPSVGSLAPLLQSVGIETPDTSLVAADGMTATTDQRIVDGALVVESVATVNGLRLLGGLVRFGSIVSRSSITSAPGAEPIVESSIEFGGVEVAGTPAQVTEEGLVVGASSSGPLAQQAARQVADLLQDSGFRVEALPVEQGEIAGVPFATVGGVLIEFSTPLAGLPPIPGPTGDLDFNGAYGVRIQAGTTGARGFAENFGNDTPASPPRPAVATGADAAGSTGTPSASSSSGGAIPSSSGATGAAPAAETTPAAPEPAGALRDLFADRMALLYLSFTLTALALCLAPRLTLPARLPAVR